MTEVAPIDREPEPERRASAKILRLSGSVDRPPPPDLTPVDLDAASTAEDLVRTTIGTSVLRIFENDPLVRLDHDVEGVHQARVGARRLRSDLGTLRPLLTGDWVDDLRVELRWLGLELGAVRDADVLLARLRADSEALVRDVDRRAAQRLLTRLEDERSQALERVEVALDSERYARLLDQLVATALAPPMTPRAAQPAVDAVPALVAKPYRKLAKAVGRLDDEPTDEQLHEIRKKAKSVRYASELAAPVVSAAARLAKPLRKLQDLLGDHHDASVAEAWLRTASADASPEEAVAAGLLVARQQAWAAERHERWRGLWAQATTKKATKWLD